MLSVLKAAFAAGTFCFLFCEGEGECKCERAAGQFSIFGATEENDCDGFARIFAAEEQRAIAVANAPDREIFCARSMCRAKFERQRGCIVHRPCTGNAERQFSSFHKFTSRSKRFQCRAHAGRMKVPRPRDYRNYPSGNSRARDDNKWNEREFIIGSVTHEHRSCLWHES